MRKPLEAGDRVRMVWPGGSNYGQHELSGRIGYVVSAVAGIGGRDLYVVRFGNGSTETVRSMHHDYLHRAPRNNKANN